MSRSLFQDQAMSTKWRALGQALRAARKAHEPPVTQEGLAEALGVSQAAISKVERGLPTSTSLLDAMCAHLNVDLRIAAVPRHAAADYEALPESGDVLSALGALSPGDRAAVIEGLRALPRLPEGLRNGLLGQLSLYAETYPEPSSKRSTA